ncbi:CRISPR-associated protein [Corynebacterium renale]|uniref:CRISPR system Cascade subunit CasD n=1 Tax=Corynebacterium renale TaxID=1724 RepID=A0A2A9DMJ2_9CORY|nr:type I-E CRISPR-associated protein Cas5/CasD [Corynebacterium renale]PFG27591.1 CRISPR system Cascade subunit CasD [Corynebacterium renale]SQG63720.1 CRISPR-associated protein [Corynebacterium renale]SQI23006.1 CRISPR-associated protein [Corynebacterium renale]STD01771.1 CRISPR-associated protein [Corynebacterium renale]
MKHSLLLLLKGPMQSWGDESRFKTRATAPTPTKSGIIGLIAAAQGRRRTDPVEDLVELRLAIRVDQSGSLLRDYQTAQPWITKPSAPAQLVTRYFLSDAAFVAAVEADDKEFLEEIASALRKPAFPLFMGRRSCPVHPGLVIGIVDADAETALREHKEWYATRQHKRESPTEVSLAVYRDGTPQEAGGIARQDVPISFDPQHRKYGWRTVVRGEDVILENPDGKDQILGSDIFFDTVVKA